MKNYLIRRPGMKANYFFRLEYHVEKSVWNMMQKLPIRQDEGFKLFCIFNRFVDPAGIPFALCHKGLNYILGALDIQLSEPIRKSLGFDDFLQLMLSKPMQELDKVFNKVVKDCIIDGKVRGKVTING